ncbi:MAG: Nitrate ABC transporter, ATP-binding protein, partial [uncultured Acidimicrobiales bacterium]
ARPRECVEVLQRPGRPAGRRPDRDPGRVRLLHRPLGLRQVDPSERGRRPARRRQRRGQPGRQGDHRAGPRPGHGLPELLAPAPAQPAGQRAGGGPGRPSPAQARPERRGGRALPAGGGVVGAQGQAAGPGVGRDAAAHGGRPSLRGRPPAPPARRALRRPRRPHPGPPAAAAHRAVAARVGDRDGAHGHPRDRRGHPAGRPDRGDGQPAEPLDPRRHPGRPAPPPRPDQCDRPTGLPDGAGAADGPAHRRGAGCGL